MLDAVQCVTWTTDADWTLESKDLDYEINDSVEKFEKGDYSNMVPLIYGNAFKEDRGSLFQGRKLANEVLGLLPQDLDVETQRAVKLAEEDKEKGGKLGFRVPADK